MTKFFLFLHKLMNFITNGPFLQSSKLQILLWCQMNLFTNLYNLISRRIFLLKHTYKNIILNVVNFFFFFWGKDIVKLSLMFMSLFKNTLLWSRLACLIVKFILGLDLGMCAKQMNINQPFSKWSSSCL